MALTDSGLWVPYELPRKKSGRRLLNFSVVSSLSLVVATATFLATRHSTEIAQRAYLSYSMNVSNRSAVIQGVKERRGDILVDYQIIIRNLGNTPALHVFHNLAATSMVNPQVKVLFNQ